MTLQLSKFQRIKVVQPCGTHIFANGFTLIEVLISLVVLSIGLLGMAKMVMVSAHSNDSAYLRGQATALAYEIIDSMRANRTAAVAQGYDIALGAPLVDPVVLCTGGTICNTTDLGNYDTRMWEKHLAVALPSGTGSIATTPVAGTVTATVIVQWDDTVARSALTVSGPRGATVATPMSIVLATQL